MICRRYDVITVILFTTKHDDNEHSKEVEILGQVLQSDFV